VDGAPEDERPFRAYENAFYAPTDDRAKERAKSLFEMVLTLNARE
jgi:hypothetical protein